MVMELQCSFTSLRQMDLSEWQATPSLAQLWSIAVMGRTCHCLHTDWVMSGSSQMLPVCVVFPLDISLWFSWHLWGLLWQWRNPHHPAKNGPGCGWPWEEMTVRVKTAGFALETLWTLSQPNQPLSTYCCLYCHIISPLIWACFSHNHPIVFVSYPLVRQLLLHRILS